MKTVMTPVLLEIVDDLGMLSRLSANNPAWEESKLNKNSSAEAKNCLEQVRDMCEGFGFKALLLQVDRDIKELQSGCTYKRLGQISENLGNRIRDEFQSLLLVWIDDDSLFGKDDLFGSQVGDRFKGASFDIREAGSCYALGRYTACVYHLMRVAEFGLRSIGKRVGYDGDRPVWEAVLKFIDAELRRNYNEMDARFKGDIEFLSGISAQMHAVNLAWRRRVAHVERTYTPEEAKQIMDATKSLMQHIAAKLSEVEQ